jgi:rhodanese-related sulfurtransferase
MHWRAGIVVAAIVTLSVGRAGLPIEPTTDTVDTIKQRLARREAVLIDVRSKTEWEQGHLSDAIWFPVDDLRKLKTDSALRDKLAKAVPIDRIVYCHCAKGVRALTAGGILEGLGYDARPLKPGFDELRNSGFEVAPVSAAK